VTDPRDVGAALELLRTAELVLQGRLVGASNATLYAGLRTPAGLAAACVYKPVAGERPLWDFPDGTLAGRELATYLVSAATGWACVPPTVVRDGPLGPGMVQLWVEGEVAALVDVVPVGSRPLGWRPVLVAEDGRGKPVELVHADDVRLRRLAVLDVVVNNGDRKGGHVIEVGGDGEAHVYGIDHGVSFSVEPKLRTVLWGWAGEPLRDDEAEVVQRLAAGLGPRGDLRAALAPHVTAAEVDGAEARARRLLTGRRLPRRGPGWPSIPWPPF
jgi:uncharacterized repeat protein (TIGR03843 family)